MPFDDHARQLFALGWQARADGDYEKSEQYFDEIEKFVRESEYKEYFTAYGESYLLYSQAVAKAHLCKTEEAELLFKRALLLEKGVSSKYSTNTGKRLFEMSNMYYDIGNYESATKYFKEGIEVLDKSNYEKKDPIGVARTLDMYANSLDKSGGDPAEIARVRERAELLRRENPEKQALTITPSYPTSCP